MPSPEESQSPVGLIAVAVAVIAIVTMVFGFWGLKKSIFSPFYRQGDGTYQTAEEREAAALALLKATDTDGDGLSDYDEQYIYRTNPFLGDTDSDGIGDGQEVTENTDPNCPAGSACDVPRTPTAPTEPEAGNGTVAEREDAGIDGQTLAFIEIFGDPRELTRAAAEDRIRTMPTGEMREFFVKMGVPSDAVAAASDDTLRQLVTEALKEISFGDEALPSE
ncbi:hypothetical protein JW899_02320 [Candidatus Uhrbacteria bacterium]|nr:hypothetical protein [Candidatus Uhrbacteria bacterium]